MPAPDGYAWWYVDALSDDGRHALTIIAFVGSVFSPYYAFARRRGPADPCEHVAINVALYGDGVRRWTMSERGSRTLQRDARMLRIGPSALAWERDGLCISLDEVAAPWPRRVLGEIRIHGALPGLAPHALDAAGRHRWQPLLPHARVVVDLHAPAARWSGTGYVDSNWGDEPLAHAFESWQWSRTALPGGDTVVHYDTRRRGGAMQRLALKIAAGGAVQPLTPHEATPLPRSAWGIARDAHDGATLRSTLEDGPFYARSLLATPHEGHLLDTVHESLSLTRFESRWVQAMLLFRMPRRG